MEILKVKNLSKIYHTKDSEIIALKNINFSINKGEIVAIVGPSGCGKSTLLSILAGIINKSDGEIICPDDVSLAYMLQDDALLPFRTILGKNYVLKLLKDYGLEDFINKYPNSLSGGMRQRVG